MQLKATDTETEDTVELRLDGLDGIVDEAVPSSRGNQDIIPSDVIKMAVEAGDRTRKKMLLAGVVALIAIAAAVAASLGAGMLQGSLDKGKRKPAATITEKQYALMAQVKELRAEAGAIGDRFPELVEDLFNSYSAYFGGIEKNLRGAIESLKASGVCTLEAEEEFEKGVETAIKEGSADNLEGAWEEMRQHFTDSEKAAALAAAAAADISSLTTTWEETLPKSVLQKVHTLQEETTSGVLPTKKLVVSVLMQHEAATANAAARRGKKLGETQVQQAQIFLSFVDIAGLKAERTEDVQRAAASLTEAIRKYSDLMQKAALLHQEADSLKDGLKRRQRRSRK